MPRIRSESDECSTQVCAFLDMLAVSELGDGILRDPMSDDGYKVIVGSRPGLLKLMTSYRSHPLPSPRDAVQIRPGLRSTAAGRYQFLSRYWPHYRDLLRLPDFAPLSQDRWAVQLIREQKALEHIEAGDLTTAVARCRNIWASLPGAGYGQHENQYEKLRQAFVNAGGITWPGIGMAGPLPLAQA